MPVADDAVLASMLRAGSVVPWRPTEKALAEADVIVWAMVVRTPAMFASPPTHNALATPTPPAVIIEPEPVPVESVVRDESMPAANGIRAVVAVCPSFVMAVVKPVPRSAVRALNAVEVMTVPVTTG
jgi:hypothetical protein